MKGLLIVGIPSVCFYLGAATFFDYRYDALAESYCAKQDAEIEGQKIATGDKVVLYYGSSNRDASVFEDPDRLDVGRTPNHHVAFGATGAHFCLGAQLARVEIDAMLREILTRLKGLELAGEPDWLSSTFISGPRTLPVRFEPARV